MTRALLPKHVAAALRFQTDPLRALQMFDALPRQEGFTHTPSTFNAMVEKLASHGHFSEMETLLARMRTSFSDAASVEPAHVCAIRAYGRRGKVHEAADVFERMDLFGIEPSVVSYNSVMDVLVEHGFFDQAHKVYLRMLHQGISPDLCTFTVRIKAFRFTRRPAAALRLLRSMRARGFYPNSLLFCSVVASLYEGSFPDDALVLFEEMLQLGLIPDIVVFNKLAHALSSLAGSGKEAHRLLCKILKRGSSPNVFTFNILLGSLCREGRSTEAAAWLRRRLDEGGATCTSAVDVVSFNIVICSLCRSSRVAEAAEFLRRMTNGGFFPDSFTYNTLIDGFCRSGLILEARQLLQDAIFKGFLPDRFTYGSLINGLCESGDLAGAAAAFRETSVAGLQPDTAVCNSLVKGLCRRGHLPQALELAADMAEGRQADAYTYNTIVHSLCRAGQITEAQALINSAMADSSFLPDIFTFNSIIDGLCRCRRLDEALDVIRRMEDSHGVRPDAITFNCILDGLCKSGKNADVEQIFNGMAAAGCAPNVISCNILIQSLCKSRRADEAVDLLARMKVMQGGLPSPDAVSYGTVIHGLCTSGELRQALELFREMEKEGYPASEMASAYNLLIAAFAGRLEPIAAADLLAEMEQRGCAPDTFAFRELIGGFCSVGDSAHALELLKKMMDSLTVVPVAMLQICGRLINCLCISHKVAEAVELVLAMVHCGYAPPGAASIFDADKRAVAAPKMLVEEMLKKGHITYHAYEILYDGVRATNLTRRRGRKR